MWRLEDLVLEQMTADPDTPFIPINKPPFILFRSESWLITIWTWIIFLLIVWVAFIVPGEIAFQGFEIPDGIWFAVHFVFILDMLSNFFIAIRDDAGNMIFEPSKIARHKI